MQEGTDDFQVIGQLSMIDNCLFGYFNENFKNGALAAQKVKGRKMKFYSF